MILQVIFNNLCLNNIFLDTILLQVLNIGKIMKIGLVLEGGGMRGLYTAGVLDVLLEQKIQVNTIVSVSAGALFGVNYASNQKGRVLRYNLKYLGDKNYMGFYSLLTTGNIVNKDFAFYKVPYTLDPFDQETFANSGIDFYITLTNVKTGKAEHRKVSDIFAEMEAFRATSAMPFVSNIVELDGNSYLDGGIADSIPLEFAQTLGCDKLIVVLTRPADYRKKKMFALLPKIFYRKYPKLIETLLSRAETYNHQLESVLKEKTAGNIFVIQPSETLKIGRLEKDPEKIKAMYKLGETDMRNSLKDLEEYLTH